MLWWSQWIAFALSLVAFVIAVLPRNYTDAHTAAASFRLYPFSRLIRFPIFWLGLVYFVIIGIQLANPAWVYMSSDRGWWVESKEHIAWLPHGVANAPYRPMNAWRTLLIHSAVWLLVCGLWIGLTRRRSARILLYTIALNGVALAVVLILQRLTNSRELLWNWPAPSSYHVATFVYKNHGGAFFALIAGLCAAFAWWHADRASRRMTKSHPGLLYVFLAIVVSVGLSLTYARASTALGLTFLIIVGLCYVVHVLFQPRGGPPPIVTTLTAVLCAAFLGLCAWSLNAEKVWTRFERLFEQDKTVSIEHRRLAASASIDMGNDSRWFGHGFGNYRYVFPWFQRNYPEIYTTSVRVKKQRTERRLFWEHAHNDYAELYAEGGWAGILLMGAVVTSIGVSLRRSAIFSQPAFLVFVGASSLVAFAAFADFPFHNPAILLTVAAVLAITLRWAAMERQSRLRAKN